MLSRGRDCPPFYIWTDWGPERLSFFSEVPFLLQRISPQTCSPVQVLGRRLALCCAWGGPLCLQAAGLREEGPLQHTWRRETGSGQTPVFTGVTLQAGGSSVRRYTFLGGQGWALRVCNDSECLSYSRGLTRILLLCSRHESFNVYIGTEFVKFSLAVLIPQ